MMDCFCCILDKLCNCFLFNGNWWKDYGIPLLGTVAIPLVVWRLTRYYGADEAEKRKERRELCDNLNLLLSVCFASIGRMETLRKEFLYLHNIEKDNGVLSNKTLMSEISKVFLSPNDFNDIDIAKYSTCIQYSQNYVLNLLNLKNGFAIKDFMLEHRNQTLKEAMDSSNSNWAENIKEFIRWDFNEFERVLTHIEAMIMCLRDFITETKELETKMDDLKLDSIIYSEKQKQLFAELEQKYAKEQKND